MHIPAIHARPAHRAVPDRVAQAITRFAAAYADQNERDHQSLLDAVAAGRLTAEPGMCVSRRSG
jgi:hypothetical protein